MSNQTEYKFHGSYTIKQYDNTKELDYNEACYEIYVYLHKNYNNYDITEYLENYENYELINKVIVNINNESQYTIIVTTNKKLINDELNEIKNNISCSISDGGLLDYIQYKGYRRIKWLK